jgi:hypothetical protein
MFSIFTVNFSLHSHISPPGNTDNLTLQLANCNWNSPENVRQGRIGTILGIQKKNVDEAIAMAIVN